MTIDERLEALTMNLELAFRDIEEQRAAERERARQTEANNARVTANIQAVAQLAATNRGDIEALTGNVEALMRLVATDAENIRSLSRIAEAHQNRLDQIQGVQ